MLHVVLIYICKYPVLSPIICVTCGIDTMLSPIICVTCGIDKMLSHTICVTCGIHTCTMLSRVTCGIDTMLPWLQFMDDEAEEASEEDEDEEADENGMYMAIPVLGIH